MPTLARLALISVATALPVTAQVDEAILQRIRPVYLWDLEFSPDGKWMATAGDAVRMYHTRTGHVWRTIQLPHATRLIRFSPTEERTFAASGSKGVVRVYKVGAKEPRLTLNVRDGLNVNSLAYSPNGQLLAAGGRRIVNGSTGVGAFRIWNAATGQQEFGMDFENIGCHAMAFSPDNKTLAVATRPAKSTDSQLRFYSTETGKLTRTIPFSPGFAASLTFAPKGDRIVIAGGECENRTASGCMPTGKLWLISLGEAPAVKLIRPEPRHGYFRSVSFTPDGSAFVSGTSQVVREPSRAYVQAQIQLRSTTTGELIWTAAGGVGDGHGARLSADGSTAAYCIDDTLHLIDAKTGKEARVLKIKRGAKE